MLYFVCNIVVAFLTHHQYYEERIVEIRKHICVLKHVKQKVTSGNIDSRTNTTPSTL